MMKPMRKKRDDRGKREESKEFDQYILDLARVTRVTKGGKHLSFRACVIIGDHKGRVGFGVAKGKDVQLAVDKSSRQAKKNLINVPIAKGTIPHAVLSKFKAAQVLLKPAPVGSGVIAGGAMRVVLELAGVPNVSAKIMSRTKNKISLVKSTFDALSGFKRPVAKEAKKDVKREEAVEKKQ
jgi:small subunit ribosomal protein S5